MTATNLTTSLLSVTSSNNVIEYIFAIDNGLNNYMIISFLFAIFIILVLSIFFWSRNLSMALLTSSITITITAFISTLIRSEIYTNLEGNPLRLLSFEKFTIFLIILVLSSIYSRVADE